MPLLHTFRRKRQQCTIKSDHHGGSVSGSISLRKSNENNSESQSGSRKAGHAVGFVACWNIPRVEELAKRVLAAAAESAQQIARGVLPTKFASCLPLGSRISLTVFSVADVVD